MSTKRSHLLNYLGIFEKIYFIVKVGFFIAIFLFHSLAYFLYIGFSATKDIVSRNSSEPATGGVL